MHRGSINRRITPLLMGAIWSVLGTMVGCGFHLHNQTDEVLAQSAQQSFKAADLDKFIANERTLVQTIDARDLAATRRNVVAQRDAAIIAALSEGQTVTAIKQLIETRWRRLIGSDPKAQHTVHDLPDMLGQAAIHRDAYVVEMSKTTNASPEFPPSVADEAAAKKVGGNAWALFVQYKTSAEGYVAAIASIQEGLIGELNREIGQIAAIKGQIATEITDAKKALSQAVAEYEQGLPKTDSSTQELETSTQKIKDALAKFDKVIEKLQPSAAALGMEDLLAQVHLERLQAAKTKVDEFLESFSAAQSGTQTKQAVSNGSAVESVGRIAALLSGTADTMQASSARARLVPLIFEQDRLRLEIDRRQRMLDRGDQRIALLQRQRDAFIAESMKLFAATNALESASKKSGKDAISDVLSGAGKAFLIDGVFLWVNSIAIDQLHEEQIAISLISLDHDEALDASEYALNLWELTIATPLEQLVQYHASGLTEDQIAQLLQAAGLAGIAVGVN